MTKSELRAYAKDNGITLAEAKEQLKNKSKQPDDPTPVMNGPHLCHFESVSPNGDLFLKIAEADFPRSNGPCMMSAPTGHSLQDCVVDGITSICIFNAADGDDDPSFRAMTQNGFNAAMLSKVMGMGIGRTLHIIKIHPHDDDQTCITLFYVAKSDWGLDKCRDMIQYAINNLPLDCIKWYKNHFYNKMAVMESGQVEDEFGGVGMVFYNNKF